MRVMLVDDTKQVLEITAQLLRCHGHEIFEFLDPRDALRVYRFNPEQFDVVITDYNMPVYNGFELSKRLIAVNPDLPILMYSAVDNWALSQLNQKMNFPVKMIFQKPVKAEDLHNGILASYLECSSKKLLKQACSCGFPDKSMTHACANIKLEVKG